MYTDQLSRIVSSSHFPGSKMVSGGYLYIAYWKDQNARYGVYNSPSPVKSQGLKVLNKKTVASMAERGL